MLKTKQTTWTGKP